MKLIDDLRRIISKKETESERNIYSLTDCENELIMKHFKKEHQKVLPTKPITYSTSIIEEHGKKFRIGIHHRSWCSATEYPESIEIDIEEIKIVPKNRIIVMNVLYSYLHQSERCKFILQNLDAVNESLKNISLQLDGELSKIVQDKECLEKCTKTLWKKLQQN